MSSRGQPDPWHPGEVTVREYGYGLGRQTGILLLHYPRQGPVEFLAARDDYAHQFYWSPDGLLSVHRGTEHGFVGADDAFWARRGVLHEVRAPAGQSVFRVLLREEPAAVAGTSAAGASLSVEARELLRGLCRPAVTEAEALAGRARIMADLGAAGVVEFGFGAGGGGPAARVARALALDPGDPTTLAEWADRLHLSAKTLQRAFQREYGASYSQVRSGLRLRAAAVLLESLPVTEVAHRVGYASASAFVAAFAREHGHTPGRHARSSG